MKPSSVIHGNATGAALIPEKPESEFQRVKRIMSLPPDFDPIEPAPWSEEEISAYAEQEASEHSTLPGQKSLT